MKRLALLPLLLLLGCATPPTAEQVAGWSAAAHTVLRGGIQDYKAIKELQDGMP